LPALSALIALAAACAPPARPEVETPPPPRAAIAAPAAVTPRPSSGPVEPPAPARSFVSEPSSLEPPLDGAITAAPIPRSSRLAPCRVELEHTFLGPDDTTWLTRRRPVHRLVREWESTRAEVVWEVAPIAPIALTFEQAQTLLRGARLEEHEGKKWIWAVVGDGTISYEFDARGRAARADWDPVADSAAYVFHYQYACDPGARPPAHDDDRRAPGGE
jgi:hypothetical protein